AALRAPAERLEQVADLVSSQPLVTHNYQREHALNLWFVIAGPHPSAVAATLADIAHLSGFAVIDLPLVKAYHLDLGFPLAGPPRRRSPPLAVGDYAHSARDRELLAAIEDGIPLTPQPYRTVGQCLGLGEEEVIGSLQRMVTATVITRFGCVVRHRALGYGANAMAVWDVPDARVDAVAQRFILSPHVTLCYRRPRRRPEWPYNLFCMVHAKTRAEARAVVADLNAVAGSGQYEQAVLFSTRCFKQRGAVFSDREGARDAA
ncbi:MAG TPA: Lrp/AsnC family transcriptional regulator, partial [Xanthobacteraceae bacterium]